MRDDGFMSAKSNVQRDGEGKLSANNQVNLGGQTEIK